MLGGAIASIEENFYGVMEKTRVYAGGAVIGEQQRWTATGQSTGETYSHIFRDPVSGSVIRGGLEEHYEPLGQKINPIPPLEEPTFPGPNDGFNDARFPEWQCQAAAARHLSGSELPAHCQRAAEQRNIAAKIDVEWPAWPEKDGNALRLVDSPVSHGSGGNDISLSFATRTMSASLTTTTKRLEGDGCDWDKDGKPDCAVTVNAETPLIDMSDTGGADASVSGLTSKLQTGVKIPTMEIFRQELVNLLDRDNGKCRDFLDLVRANMDIDKTVEEMFDKLVSKGGAVVVDAKIPFAHGKSHWGKGGKNIGLGPVTDRWERYITNAIHELFHRAGEEHSDFATAAFKALSKEDQKKSPLPTEKLPGYDMSDTNSIYFTRLLNTYCPAFK